MKKLLSFVLSISILVTSVTPSFAGPRVKKVKPVSPVRMKKLSTPRIQTQLGQALYRQAIAQLRKQSKNPTFMRRTFVDFSLMRGVITPAQRATAVTHYTKQLKNAHTVFQLPKTPEFLVEQNPRAQLGTHARDMLADASALALVGERAHAPELLHFYEQAKGTLFEDVAALITARGLLRMQAYEELGKFLTENAGNTVLSGVVEYIGKYEVPAEIPAALRGKPVKELPTAWADFLEKGDSPYTRLHADASLQATERWMEIGQEQAPVLEAQQPVLPAMYARLLDVTEPAKQEQPAAQQPAPAAQHPAQGATPTPVATVEPPAAGPARTATAASETAGAQKPASRRPTSRSGIVYSGIPVFAIIDGISNLAARIRNRFSKKEKAQAPYEEPGLHDNEVRPIYERAEEPVPAESSGELIATDGAGKMVPVGADGFKLTIEGEDKVEHILHHVNLIISSTLKNFSSQYNRLVLSISNIFELRNQTLPSKRPDHFYFVLSTGNGEFAKLVEGARRLNLARPMRIKIQQKATARKMVTLAVYDMDLRETPILADVDVSLLPRGKKLEEGRIIFHENELYFYSAQGEMTILENAFVRLSKGEAKHWTKILALYPETKFEIGVFSTMDKMPPITYLVPSLQVGLGKTLAPVLHDMSTLGETTSTAVMMGINNVLPVLMGFVHPFLKRHGEAAVFRVGAAMFSLGGLVALASGLYGHVGSGIMSHWQLAGFLTSSVCIALGTNITRLVQNIIMSANRGIVPLSNSFKTSAKQGADGTAITYNMAHLLKRTKEVFTKKSNKTLRDVVYFQLGAMFKNLGTMLFLSFPWLANLAGKAVGVDLGLDFSASYVPYTLYSLYTLNKLRKIPYKDAFPTDLLRLKHRFQDVRDGAIKRVAQMEPKDINAEQSVIRETAQNLHSSIEALVLNESRKTKKSPKELGMAYEAETLALLEKHLKQEGRAPQEVQAARQALQDALDDIGHRHVRLRDVIVMAGLPTSLAAMALATLGELGLSNGLAFAMREIVGNGTEAAGIVGLLLYGCMFSWRIVGNMLSQRMSGGSMYALSSTAGILGPIMMALSHGNAPMLVSGAIISCFGISNFFSQMYEYMVGLHPKYKREIALLINYTMPVAAIGASLLRLTSSIQGLDMGLAGAALTASVALTPGMLANSSFVRMIQHGWKHAKTRFNNTFHKKNGGNEPPMIENPAQ